MIIETKSSEGALIFPSSADYDVGNVEDAGRITYTEFIATTSASLPGH